jgi:hypothetical protein
LHTWLNILGLGAKDDKCLMTSSSRIAACNKNSNRLLVHFCIKHGDSLFGPKHVAYCKQDINNKNTTLQGFDDAVLLTGTILFFWTSFHRLKLLQRVQKFLKIDKIRRKRRIKRKRWCQWIKCSCVRRRSYSSVRGLCTTARIYHSLYSHASLNDGDTF